MIKHIDDNFSQHSWKVPEQTNGMCVTHSKNLTYVDSGLSCDTFNIIHIHNGRDVLTNEIEVAVEYFTSRQLDYCIWINSENLSKKVEEIFSAKTISRHGEEAGMLLALEEYQKIENNQHSNIRIVSDSNLLQEYANVVAENWSPPDQNVLKYYEATADHYLSKRNNIILLVYYHEGKPVSTVEMFPSSNETIGLYGFATLASHRGFGIGTSLMTFALNKGKELGYQRAILQASKDGIGIYRKFGFEELTMYFEYT